MLFCPCVVWKGTAQVGTKALNMRHQSKKGFLGIFVGIPKHQKGYLMYVPSTWKIISSYDFVFDESFTSVLAYMSQPYSETLVIRPTVRYTSCIKSLKGNTDNIITLSQFEEGNI